jgi:hypothetical protein
VTADAGIVSEQPPAALADLPQTMALPSVRAGAPFEYSATIEGSTASEVLSGELPPGLGLSAGQVRGRVSAASLSGPSQTYSFSVALDSPAAGDSTRASVSVTVFSADMGDEAPPRYWEPGPYFSWNTRPKAECADNPTIDLVAREQDVDMYVTYPTVADPTENGDGSVAPGRWPVIVFAHANNDSVCDIFERYYSLHDHWATWGYIVVAIDGTATNCQQGTRLNIEDRSDGQLRALEALERLDANPSSRFHSRIDLTRIVFAGHSRGGGSSLWSAELFGRASAIIDLQGIDLTAFGFGADPIVPIPVLGMTAGEDVDVNYPGVEPTEDQLSGPYTWVNINGAIHAHTADTVPIEPDDVPLISRQAQHDIIEYFTTAFLARHIGVGNGETPAVFRPLAEADPVLYSFQGAKTVNEELSDLGVHVRWNRRPAALLIDTFDGPRTGSASTNLLGGDNVDEGELASSEVPTYQPDTAVPSPMYAKAMSRLLVGGATSGAFRTYLASDRSPVEVGAGARLLARVKGLDAGNGAALAFSVEVEGSMATGTVDGALFIGPETLSNRFTQLDIPLSELTTDSAITSVRSVAFYVTGGSIFVDDLRIE